MGIVRLVHLSDLHFVPGKQDAQVWEVVRDFINQTVKPHAILITGDVTDSATHAKFELAKQSLGGLQVQPGGDAQKFRIVAGNHDRYVYRGNQPPVGRAWLSRRWWPKDKAARFDHCFPGAVQVAPGAPCSIELTDLSDPGQVPWKVRVIGLDSSATQEWFAQGAVSATDIHKVCEDASNASQQDLVVALVHHHVLPIPAVERQRMSGGGLRRLMDATGMLNSGALMEALSRTQVDLVLHGHEHMPHQARFKGSDELASDVAVLGAGSATGDETLQGWSLDRVHFNVIELDDDRTVWLRQVYSHKGQLGYQGPRRLILEAKDIRLSRFIRRNRGLATDRQATRRLPASRLRKVVDFRGNRDIELVDSRTNWQVNPTWNFTTQSGSGTVGDAYIRFEWIDGDPTTYKVSATPAGREHDQFMFQLELPGMSRPRMARRVTTRWKWAGAAVFTRDELAMLPHAAKGGPRRDWQEFASVSCTGEFEELALSLRLPPRFAPDPASVRVYYETDLAPGTQIYSNEFLGGLESCGPGNFDLRIAYPMPGFRYGLSWPVLQMPTESPEQDAFVDGLVHRRDVVEQAMARWLAAWGFRNVRWSLFARQAPQRQLLRQLWGGAAAGPGILMLNDARSLARAALWGDVVVAQADENNQRYEFLPDEVLIAYVALRPSRELAHQAHALLRVAFTANPMGSQGEESWMRDFRAFARVAGMVLPAAALNHPVLL
jgi:3',5'-cyclic AMP phosphodiesterase CpdA